MSRLFVLGLLTEMLNLFTAPMDCLLKQILRVGADGCFRPRVNAAPLLMTYLVMDRLLLPVLVPISPDETTLKREHAEIS